MLALARAEARVTRSSRATDATPGELGGIDPSTCSDYALVVPDDYTFRQLHRDNAPIAQMMKFRQPQVVMLCQLQAIMLRQSTFFPCSLERHFQCLFVLYTRMLCWSSLLFVVENVGIDEGGVINNVSCLGRFVVVEAVESSRRQIGMRRS